MLEDIYGNPVKNLSTAIVVSLEEAEILCARYNEQRLKWAGIHLLYSFNRWSDPIKTIQNHNGSRGFFEPRYKIDKIRLKGTFYD